jgi:hypothetical protein
MTNWKTMAGGETYPTWEPKEKDTIEGILREKRTMIGPNNSNLYVLEDPKGKSTSVWGSTVLDGRIGKLPIGTLVKITFLGLAKGKKGTEYKNYEVQYDADTMPQEDIVEAAKREFGA